MKKLEGWNRFLGRMFKSKNYPPIYMEFDPPDKRPINTIFVFHTLKVKWTFEDGTTEERIIKPFRDMVYPKTKKAFIRLDEEYYNTSERRLIEDVQEKERL